MDHRFHFQAISANLNLNNEEQIRKYKRLESSCSMKDAIKRIKTKMMSKANHHIHGENNDRKSETTDCSRVLEARILSLKLRKTVIKWYIWTNNKI